MTFHGRRASTQSHAGNSFCALETTVSALYDALRKIYIQRPRVCTSGCRHSLVVCALLDSSAHMIPVITSDHHQHIPRHHRSVSLQFVLHFERVNRLAVRSSRGAKGARDQSTPVFRRACKTRFEACIVLSLFDLPCFFLVEFLV